MFSIQYVGSYAAYKLYSSKIAVNLCHDFYVKAFKDGNVSIRRNFDSVAKSSAMKHAIMVNKEPNYTMVSAPSGVKKNVFHVC